tara:strand:- start:5969 stop:6811 length:843 start_codon:yes stop_codon:yes gene_type:complete
MAVDEKVRKMRIKCITTFHQPGLEQYGQRLIDSWAKNVHPAIKLIVYAEDCIPVVPPGANITVVDAKQALPKLNAFKERHKNDPKANGKCPWPARRPRDHHKEFKWDAVRFANKTYAVFEAAQDLETDILVWIDGDTYVHSPITYGQFRNLVPASQWLHYLGRMKKWPECGWYGLTLRTPGADAFLKEFERVYEEHDDGIFKMEEWHDSYVFDEVLKKIRIKHPNIKDFSGHLVNGEGHPLINCELGAWFDHLKGVRKEEGRSRKKDLLQPRSETYWNEV